MWSPCHLLVCNCNRPHTAFFKNTYIVTFVLGQWWWLNCTDILWANHNPLRSPELTKADWKQTLLYTFHFHSLLCIMFVGCKLVGKGDPQNLEHWSLVNSDDLTVPCTCYRSLCDCDWQRERPVTVCFQDSSSSSGPAEQASEAAQEGQQGNAPPPVDANPDSPMDVDQPGMFISKIRLPHGMIFKEN